MTDRPVDLTVCPRCGAQDFRLASEERLTAYADIHLERDEGGGLSARWSGNIDVDWDTSSTSCYLCRECGGVLPEWYAALLDGMLGNRRPLAEKGEE